MKIANVILSVILLLAGGNFVFSQTLEHVSSIVTPGDCRDLITEGDIAYVADGEMGLSLFDITDHQIPNYLGTAHATSDDIAKSVWKREGENIAWVADVDGRIMTVDVSLPLDPNSSNNVTLGFDQNLQDIYGIVIQDTIYICAVSSEYSHRVLSIFQMVYRYGIPGLGDYYVIPPFDLPASAYGVYAESSYVYVADGVAGLIIFDIGDIGQPEPASHLDLIGRSLSIMVQGNYAYLAAETAGLLIVDVSDRLNPVMISQYDTPGHATDVHVVGNYAYLVDNESGLNVIDITDPAVPSFVCGYETSGSANGIYANDNYIYVADFDSLLIFDFNPTGLIETQEDIAGQFSIRGNYPNPFNVSTTLSFSIYETGNVLITIYNLAGQKIRTLVNEVRSPGEYKIAWDAKNLPSGVYFAKLEIGDYSESAKLMLLK